MSVRVQLDRPHAHFTNLDFLSGRVHLNITCDEAVSSIVVKLEGESKTRLLGSKAILSDGQQHKKTEVEVHKVSECCAIGRQRERNGRTHPWP